MEREAKELEEMQQHILFPHLAGSFTLKLVPIILSQKEASWVADSLFGLSQSFQGCLSTVWRLFVRNMLQHNNKGTVSPAEIHGYFTLFP